MAFDVNSVPDSFIAQLEDQAIAIVEDHLGLTTTQAAAYIALSKQENPQFSPAEMRDDAAHKFVHGWRIGELPIKLGGAVDELKDTLLPFCYTVVDAAIAGGA